LPVAFRLTKGQAHDRRNAADMLEGLDQGQVLLADRAYESDKLRQNLEQQGAWAKIKPMPNRKNIPPFSSFLYRYRSLLERFLTNLSTSAPLPPASKSKPKITWPSSNMHQPAFGCTL
jgi:transposase